MSRIFNGEPYEECVAEYAQSTLAGEKDDLLIYCRLPIADVVVQPFGGENLMAITIS